MIAATARAKNSPGIGNESAATSTAAPTAIAIGIAASTPSQATTRAITAELRRRGRRGAASAPPIEDRRGGAAPNRASEDIGGGGAGMCRSRTAVGSPSAAVSEVVGVGGAQDEPVGATHSCPPPSVRRSGEARAGRPLRRFHSSRPPNASSETPRAKQSRSEGSPQNSGLRSINPSSEMAATATSPIRSHFAVAGGAGTWLSPEPGASLGTTTARTR